MTHEYQRPPETEGLRLHLNENTAGCSPRVTSALRDLTRERIAFYPNYDGIAEAVAARFRVVAGQRAADQRARRRHPRRGDRGAFASAGSTRRSKRSSYGRRSTCTKPAPTPSAGGSSNIPPQPDFVFPLDRVTEAITPRHAGHLPDESEQPDRPLDSARHGRRRGPRGAAGPDLPGRGLRRLRRRDDDRTMRRCGGIPNLVVGRTFAKAYGLAGLRIGALVGSEATLAPMRRAVPPYTLNVFAAAALPAALEDVEYYDWYLARSARRRRCSTTSWRALRVRYWPSDAQLRARLLRRRPRQGHPRGSGGAASPSATVRAIPGAPGARASPRAWSNTPGASSRRSRRCYAARGNRPQDHRDEHRHPSRARRQGADTRSRPASGSSITCWSSSPAMAASTCARTPTATSTSISTIPSKTSASPSAKRSRRRSGTAAASIAPATSSCRWTRRSASRRSISAAASTP